MGDATRRDGTPSVPESQERAAEPVVMPMPTAHDVFRSIIQASTHQIATTPQGKAIVAAGLGRELELLIQQVAANAANPIVVAFEDATVSSEAA